MFRRLRLISAALYMCRYVTNRYIATRNEVYMYYMTIYNYIVLRQKGHATTACCFIQEE